MITDAPLLTIPDGKYLVKKIKPYPAGVGKCIIILENDLILLAEPWLFREDATKNIKEIMKVKIKNGDKLPLQLRIGRIALKFSSYRTLLTKGDIVEELL